MPKISELAAAAALAVTDTLALVQGGVTKVATMAQVATSVLAAPVITGIADITQSFRISGVITPAQITANQDNYNPSGLSTAAVLRLSSDASRNITGMSGGAAGRILILRNVGTFDIVLKNEVLSTAVNRFSFGVDRTLAAGRSIILQYDNTLSRWVDLVPLTKAAIADLLVGLNDERFVTPATLYGASAVVLLTDAATVTPDFGAGINFQWTLGGNRTLAAPTGMKDGQTGVIYFIQDGTGSRTLTVSGLIKSPGALPPLLSTAAGAVDRCGYFCRNVGGTVRLELTAVERGIG